MLKIYIYLGKEWYIVVLQKWENNRCRAKNLTIFVFLTFWRNFAFWFLTLKQFGLLNFGHFLFDLLTFWPFELWPYAMLPMDHRIELLKWRGSIMPNQEKEQRCSLRDISKPIKPCIYIQQTFIDWVGHLYFMIGVKLPTFYFTFDINKIHPYKRRFAMLCKTPRVHSLTRTKIKVEQKMSARYCFSSQQQCRQPKMSDA